MKKEDHNAVPDSVLTKEFLSQFKTEDDVSKFLNLLKNAREAIGEQEGHIWITAHIDSAERIIIDVCNDCGPIPNEIAENIFTPFFTTKQDGSGIGLAVSRQIVRLHGGTLRLTSNRHNKIAFTLVLD